MKTTRSIFLSSIALLSLATVPVACGSYRARARVGSESDGAASTSGGTTGSGGVDNGSGGAGDNGSGGAAGNGSGGADSPASGGTTMTSGGGAGGNQSGGTTVKPSGGAAGNASGGTTVKQDGGAGGNGNGGVNGSGGATSNGSGGVNGTGGVNGSGGVTGKGGAPGTGGSSTGAGGSSPSGTLPGDVLNNAGNKVVAAHSTVRVIVSSYTGPLYQVCKGTANPGPSSCKGTTQDIGSKGGYGDAAAQDAFCPAGTACTISKIYDQSGMKNDLEPAPAGGTVRSPDKPANAGDLKVTINGQSVYGLVIKNTGMGYRTGCSGCNIKTTNGMATGDQPQTMYMVTSQKDLVDGCCFDYGNAETDSGDDGNGTMETIYFGGGVSWGTGYGGKPGPWVEADEENGLYAGWDSTKTSGQDQNITTNKPLKFDFVTAIVLGDTQEKNNKAGRFALLGADATGADATYGKLATMYDGMRPQRTGYVPMHKQGSLILGIGGDNSNSAGGRFYEGAVATGPCATQATLDALQAAIVAAKYGK